MDNSLFSKYQKAIQADTNKKEAVIQLIESVSGLTLTPEEIVLKKKEVSLVISSAKKSHLHKFKVKEALAEIGYNLTY